MGTENERFASLLGRMAAAICAAEAGFSGAVSDGRTGCARYERAPLLAQWAAG